MKWWKLKSREFVDVQEKKKAGKFRVDYSWIVKNLFFLVFLFLLALLYIANGHYAVKNIREINALQTEVKELNWRYLDKKSQLMFNSKLSEVSKRAQSIGLHSPETPPLIIKKEK